MQDQNLDINLVIQSFQEKVSQLITENVVKDATIKQLSVQIQKLMNPSEEFETAKENLENLNKKDK